MNPNLILALVGALVFGAAQAKLPAPTDEQKAKTEEAKAKAAEGAKKDGELLGKTQDRVAERYIKEQKAKGIVVQPTPLAVAPAPAAAPAPAVAAAPAVAPAPAAPAAPVKK
jgi:hypothetical protein